MDEPLFLIKEGKEHCYLKLEWSTRVNQTASEAEGRPVHDKVLVGYLIIPGSKDQPSKTIETHKPDGTISHDGVWSQKYADYIETFKKTGEGSGIGTPLKSWPAMEIDIVANMVAAKVFTVEALAELPDSALGRLGMGAREWRTKAKAYLENAKGPAEAQRLAVENARLKDDMERMQATVGLLSAKLDELMAAKQETAA